MSRFSGALAHPSLDLSFMEKPMSSATYRLTRIHRSLDEAIARELKGRVPNSLKLLRLKKLRLQVKDRLAMLMRARATA